MGAPSSEIVRLRELLENYQEELLGLLDERKALDNRILPLQHRIRHLSRMCDITVDDPIRQLGLTDAIRYIIRNQENPIAPTEVRNELLQRYCKPKDYRNLLGAVHTVMKRLARAGEITFDCTKAEWTGGPPQSPVIGFSPARRNGRKA
jgi:hypothetical protein